jgi:acyl-coenzyme A thioesterase PaaI-like protein
VTVIAIHNEDWGFESNCFVCEPKNGHGLRIPFFHDTDTDVVFADFELGRDFSGAPSLVHGGLLLAVLDEAMAWACIASDTGGR